MCLHKKRQKIECLLTLKMTNYNIFHFFYKN